MLEDAGVESARSSNGIGAVSLIDDLELLPRPHLCRISMEDRRSPANTRATEQPAAVGCPVFSVVLLNLSASTKGGDVPSAGCLEGRRCIDLAHQLELHLCLMRMES